MGEYTQEVRVRMGESTQEVRVRMGEVECGVWGVGCVACCVLRVVLYAAIRVKRTF